MYFHMIKKIKVLHIGVLNREKVGNKGKNRQKTLITN